MGMNIHRGEGVTSSYPDIRNIIIVTSHRFLSPNESASLLSQIPAKKKPDNLSANTLIDIFSREKVVPVRKQVPKHTILNF